MGGKALADRLAVLFVTKRYRLVEGGLPDLRALTVGRKVAGERGRIRVGVLDPSHQRPVRDRALHLKQNTGGQLARLTGWRVV